MLDYSFITDLDSDDLRTAAYRELGKVDLYFLSRYILGYDLEELTDIHSRFCAIADENRLRQMMLMFRGSYKTSLGIAKVIQWLIQDPAAQIGIGSDKIERAAERTREVRRILASNSLLKTLYPDIFYNNPERESDLWTQSEFNIKRPNELLLGFTKPSVSSYGLFPLPTGSHYTHSLVDDLESEESVNTPDLIVQLNVRTSSLIPTLRPNAPLLLLGTIYCPDGPNTLLQKIWPSYKVPIIDRNGLPTFPTKFGANVIAQLRRDVNDEYVWQGQYMLAAAIRTDKYLFPFKDVILNQFTEMLQ